MSTTLRSSTGDMVLPRVILTSLGDVVAQTIRDGLGLWKGEFFLNTNDGFDWTAVLGVKVPRPTLLGLKITKFLLTVPGVRQAVASATYDGGKRHFAYEFTAGLNDGTVLTRTPSGTITQKAGV